MSASQKINLIIINFIRKLEEDDGMTLLFIAEKQQKSALDFFFFFFFRFIKRNRII